MSWQEELQDLARRWQEQERGKRRKVTPEQRANDGARGTGGLIGLVFGTIMAFRIGHTLAVELAFWLFLAVMVTISIGRARGWPAIGMATAPLVAAATAVGVTLTLGIVGLMTWSY